MTNHNMHVRIMIHFCSYQRSRILRIAEITPIWFLRLDVLTCICYVHVTVSISFKIAIDETWKNTKNNFFIVQ